jgi:hypothetical protein
MGTVINTIEYKGLRNTFKKIKIKNHVNNKILKRKIFFFIKYQKYNFIKVPFKINHFLKYLFVKGFVINVDSDKVSFIKLKNNFFRKTIMFINLYFY